MSSCNVVVEPWPQYPEDGGPPSWNVRIEAGALCFEAKWSCQMGRFVRSWSIMNLRRGAPKTHAAAVEFMRNFCPKKQQIEGDDA